MLRKTDMIGIKFTYYFS